MVRIRLRRVGGKKQPSYRVVAADKESPRDGKFLEIVGFYNPRTEPATIHLKEDRIFDWLSKGAQPSEAVVKLFNIVGTLERFERYKAGEPLDKLMEEAMAAEEARVIDRRTRRETPTSSKKKVKEAQAESAPES
jgi:small subunit ribosomal protein S16